MHNLGMISHIQEDVSRLYTNATPFHIKDFSPSILASPWALDLVPVGRSTSPWDQEMVPNTSRNSHRNKGPRDKYLM